MGIRSISMIAGMALMVVPASAERMPRDDSRQSQRQMQQMQRQAERQQQRQIQPAASPAPPQQHLRPGTPMNVPPASVARANPNPGPGAPRTGNWLREHQDETLQQQEQALRADPGFQRLPPQRQEQLLKQLQNFNSRTPEQREQMLNRMETLESFTPEQRQQVRAVWEQFRGLPMDRRQRVHQIYQQLRCMIPSERQATLVSDRFRNNFSDQERGIINGALSFGVPVNGGAQPNCTGGPVSLNAFPEDLLLPDAATWAALQAPRAVPAVVAGAGADSPVSLRSVGNGLVADGTATIASDGSSGSSRRGRGTARLNGPGGTGDPNSQGSGPHIDPSPIPTDDLIQQIVTDALDHLQVECSAGSAGDGSALSLGEGSHRLSEPRLSDAGTPFEGDLARLLAQAQAEPNGEALAQQIMNVLTAAIQSRQDDRADQACVNRAMLEFAAEIERALGVRHAISGGREIDPALYN